MQQGAEGRCRAQVQPDRHSSNHPTKPSIIPPTGPNTTAPSRHHHQHPPHSTCPSVHLSIPRALRATLGPSHPQKTHKTQKKHPGFLEAADLGPRPSSSRGAQQERAWHGGLLLNKIKNKKKTKGKGENKRELNPPSRESGALPHHGLTPRTPEKSGALSAFFRLPLRPLFVHQRPARAAASPERSLKTPGRGFPLGGHRPALAQATLGHLAVSPLPPGPAGDRGQGIPQA